MRTFRIISRVLAVVAIILFLGKLDTVSAKPADSLKAAFVRGGDLWIKSGGAERQLTKGEYLRNPKWSYDGEWLAYTKGEDRQELRLWHIPTARSQAVSATGGGNYQWSPARNRLAFLEGQKLSWISAEKPNRSAEVAQAINNFSWLPDGSGFVASTTAELLPDGWTPVRILEIPLTGNGNGIPAPQGDPGASVKTLYVLPKQSDDFFAVGTSVFKFSDAGKWLAFLATPTASLSADANTLCILSTNGAFFRKVDQMANNSEWFSWADRGDKLAYIGGVGREATNNKQLKVVEAPSGKPVAYTPAGYVDQSFSWEGVQHIIVSRAKEWKGAVTGGPATKPLPNLVEIKLQGPRYKPLTQAPRNYGDFNPQYLPHVKQIGWVRSDRSKADVLISGSGGKHPLIWIKNVDAGANFYEQWRWSDVLSFYST